MKNPSTLRIVLTLIAVAIIVIAICYGISQALQALGADGVLYVLIALPIGAAVGGISGRIAARSLWGQP